MSSNKSTKAKLPGVNNVNPHEWVNLYADYLYTYALTRLNDAEQARDLVQETFLAALERVAQFEGKSTERTWLTAILKHKIVDVYRRRSSGLNRITEELNAQQEQLDFFDAGHGHWNTAYQPHLLGIENQDPVSNKEFARILQQCIQKLPALWMAVFTMKHMEEQSTDIICSELKVSPSNFWVIIHRAKLNLRQCLQKNWF